MGLSERTMKANHSLQGRGVVPARTMVINMA